MAIEVVSGTSQKPVSSEQLGRLLAAEIGLSGRLFIGYPIIGTPAGPYMVDALLISKEMGIVAFDLIEGSDPGDYASRQDDSANMLEARLRTYKDLIHRRSLLIPISTISFAPGLSNPIQNDHEYPIVNSTTVIAELQTITWPEQRDEVYERVLSALEGISTIRQSRARRTIKSENSRGAKLKRLEDSIATLDNTQGKAVIETVDGVQRIRGLAGSGKTIVLALKAAYLHAQHPEWRIAVTFNARSLKGLFRRLINIFSVEQTNQEPDWEHLRILNAWGAPGGPERDGLYYEFCREHNADYFNFGSAKSRFGSMNAFSKVCELAVRQVRPISQSYDAILIDEAQDFSAAFLQLCYALLKDPKRLVYAYDELQSLTGESLPSPEDIFGGSNIGVRSAQSDDANGYGPQHDIILDTCYRNSRPVLITAHALGFGIYRQPPVQGGTGLVQMFDNPQLWKDVGYRVKSGEISDGQQVSLYRPEDTSPKFLESHSSIDDLIQFISFDDEKHQAEWLAQAIKKNLTEDELRHDDIVVINPDPITTRVNSGPVRDLLAGLGINSHIAGEDTEPDTFYRDESVTFTGIYRAKGNEAGMVYILNAQDCHSSARRNLATIRNRLFTAITRSKSWIRVLGVGSDMDALIYEYEQLKEAGFALDFVYPDDEQRKQLRIVHRDIAEGDRRRLEVRRRGMAELIEDLQSGNVLAEDLDPDLVAKLKELLN